MLNSRDRNFRDLFKKAPIGYIVLDYDLNIKVFNNAFLRSMGERSRDILDNSLKKYVSEACIPKLIEARDGLIEDREFKSVNIYIENNGKRFYANLSMDIIILDEKEYITCIIIDISSEKNASEELEHLSFHDQLTGLYNRRFFEKELERLDVLRNLPLTVVMADVNGLKLINDSFGHLEGDMILKKVSQAFKRACREDDIIARIGGDEFIIILPNTDKKQAQVVIDRVKNELKKEKSSKVELSVSFGFGTKEEVEEDILVVYKRSEDEMYRNKLIESQEMRNKTIEKALLSLYLMNSQEATHSKGISELAKRLSKELDYRDLSEEEIEKAGLIHDLGKIAIDKDILLKAGPLTEEEKEKINKHPEVAYHMISSIHDMLDIAKIVLHHHERWDGEGYPKGLKGEKIPMGSRILAICEAYDYMTTDTNYRKAYSREYAIEEIRKNKGSQFDSDIVDVFLDRVIGDKELEVI